MIGRPVARSNSAMDMETKALVFDYDGVIADTEPLYWKAWVQLLAPHGIGLSWQNYCTYGRGIPDGSMLRALPELAANPLLLATLEQQLNVPVEMVRAWCSQQSPVPEPTVRMLQSLHGYRIGLVTSSGRAGVEPVLRAAGINACFHAFVFAEDCPFHKPDPGPYRMVLERLGAHQGIAFEDSDAGMKSASSAGLTAIRVDDPRRLPEIVNQALQLPRA